MFYFYHSLITSLMCLFEVAMTEGASTLPRIITPVPSTLWWPQEREEEPGGTERGRMTAIEFFLTTAVGSQKQKLKEMELEVNSWVRGQSERGLVRVYRPDVSESKLVQCILSTSAQALADTFECEAIYVQLYDDLIRRLEDIENPLEVQNQLLKQLGYQDLLRLKKEGRNPETANYIKFYAGRPRPSEVEERLHLKGTFRVKQVGWMHRWEYRYCILCGSRLLIFRSAVRRGRPFVLNISDGGVEEHRLSASRGIENALRLYSSQQKRCVLIAFNTWAQYTAWFKKASKMTSRGSNELNLTSCCLENIPDHLFLHWSSHVRSLNLEKNFMRKQADPLPVGVQKEGPAPLGYLRDLPKLINLQTLTLSDNEIAAFPFSICNIPTLKCLDLSRNLMSDLPEEIGRLRSLESLSLHSNQLSTLPSELSSLDKLNSLTVSFNNFSSFPKVILTLSSLQNLIISGNKISQLPDDIDRIAMLERLDLRLNPMSGCLPDSLKLMDNLTQLDITQTGLDKFDFSLTPYLQKLTFNSSTAQAIYLDNTCAREVLISWSRLHAINFTNLPGNLVTLDVSRNALKELPEALCDLPLLRDLDVSHNFLTNLPARIFWNMKALVILKAAANQLKELPDRIDRCLLEVLDASQNQLASLPAALLLRLTALRELNLSSNQLTGLPRTSNPQGMRMLRLLLAHNKFTETTVAVVSEYKALLVLDLSYNFINAIADHFFAKMNDLEYVNLSGNRLTELPSHLASCSKLQTLFAHTNRLTHIPDLSPCSSLRDLDLSSNMLQSLPLEAQSYFPKLRYLDVSDNTSLKLGGSSISSLRTIKRLILEGVFDVPMILSSMMPTGTVDCATTSSYHWQWCYGSSETRTLPCLTSNPSPDLFQVPYKIAFVKDAGFRRGRDGLFGIIEGYPTAEVAAEISLKLPQIILSEVDENSREISAQYLKYAVLSANKLLGRVGHISAASLAICHILQIPGGYVLNTANVGQVEVVISRQGKPITLTQLHTVTKNVKERERVMSRRGFITEDRKVMGLSPTTRALGAFNLYPVVIPDPSLNTLRLSSQDEFLIIASRGVWDVISYDQAVKAVAPLAKRPTQAAKRLRDLALSTGCQDNIAVLVVCLSIPSSSAGSERLGTSAGSYNPTSELSGYKVRRSGRFTGRTKFEGIQEM